MITLFTILTTLVGALLMSVVIIQNPKGSGIDPAFGGSEANQMIGAAKSSNLIEKLTWGLAIALFAFCIITAMIVTGSLT